MGCRRYLCRNGGLRLPVMDLLLRADPGRAQEADQERDRDRQGFQLRATLLGSFRSFYLLPSYLSIRICVRERPLKRLEIRHNPVASRIDGRVSRADRERGL